MALAYNGASAGLAIRSLVFKGIALIVSLRGLNEGQTSISFC